MDCGSTNRYICKVELTEREIFFIERKRQYYVIK